MAKTLINKVGEMSEISPLLVVINNINKYENGIYEFSLGVCDFGDVHWIGGPAGMNKVRLDVTNDKIVSIDTRGSLMNYMENEDIHDFVLEVIDSCVSGNNNESSEVTECTTDHSKPHLFEFESLVSYKRLNNIREYIIDCLVLSKWYSSEKQNEISDMINNIKQVLEYNLKYDILNDKLVNLIDSVQKRLIGMYDREQEEFCIKLSEGNSSKYKTDPYLSDYKSIKRLIKEWVEHDGIIIAFDFDNTVFDYHGEGYTYFHVINLLKEAKEMGCTLILYTSCAEEKQDEMKKYLKENNIYPDYVNQTPDYIPFGHDGSKIYYNLFLDDRAGLGSAVHVLEETIKAIKSKPKE